MFQNKYNFWQKSISLLLILIFLGYTNFSIFLPKVQASTKTINNLVVLLVAEDLFTPGKENTTGSLSHKIYRYAEDIRKKMNKTKTKILTVKKNTKPIFIADVLERLYFDGEINDYEENHLTGVILIGDIPQAKIPIKNGQYASSLAPYTDFQNKAFIYSPLEKKYIKHIHEFIPEIWHGLIPSLSSAEALKKYFNQLHEYYLGNKQINKEVFHADFIAEEKSFDTVQYQMYQNTINYSEEIAYQRYSAKLLDKLFNNFNSNLFPEKSDLNKQLESILEKEEDATCL